jgi:hypothetical protein
VRIRVLKWVVVVRSVTRQIGVALTLASVSLLGCGAALGPQSQPTAAWPRPGTYEVRICTAPCDPEASDRAYATGFLVLETTPYSQTEVQQAAPQYRNRARFLLLAADGQPNACFALNRRPGGAFGHAGIRPAALTRWVGDQTGAEVTILLYRSADASYTAHLTRRGDELRGRGVSRGGFEPGDVIPTDSIHARRVGPVDRSLCLQRAATDTVGLPRRNVPVPGRGETPGPPYAPPPAAQRVPSP